MANPEGCNKKQFFSVKLVDKQQQPMQVLFYCCCMINDFNRIAPVCIGDRSS
jgi:hypothetical protein